MAEGTHEPRRIPDTSAQTTRFADRFRRDGVVHLQGAFVEWLDVLRAGVERNMAAPGPYTREYEPEGSQGYFFGDYCNWARISEYRDFVFRSGAAALAARLMQSGTARFFHEHVLVKEPKTESRTPWHHDLPYYCIDGTQCVSFWTALDPVPARGLPGARRGLASLGESPSCPGSSWASTTGARARRWTPCRTSTGAATISRSSPSTWRRATPSPSTSSPSTARRANASASARRRAFVHRWVGDDVRFKVRPGEVSPPFPEVHERLGDGDPLDDPEFPARVAGLRGAGKLPR